MMKVIVKLKTLDEILKMEKIERICRDGGIVIKGAEKILPEIVELFGTETCLYEDSGGVNYRRGNTYFELKNHWVEDITGEWKEIDWEKVPVDTKVYVKNHRVGNWSRRHFAYKEGDYIYTYEDGKTSFTWDKNKLYLECWLYGKLVDNENLDLYK